MCTTIKNVHHWRWQNMSIRAAKILIQWQTNFISRSTGSSQGNTQDRIGTELAFIRRAIKIDHGLVNQALFGDVKANHSLSNFIVYVVNGLQNTLAAKTILIAITQFNGFMFTG